MSKFLTHTFCKVLAIVELNAPGLRERKYVGVHKVIHFFSKYAKFGGRNIILTSTRNISSKIKKVDYSIFDAS